ncbi:8148_t:CDS:1 [Paraglomus brasilianum]|uniref:8148_t:CDS:1 n=1 Tax=Paraglomus brasilianum TaxID=144538 RepID=A0A9N9B229_9GLOM|nr:8148_t:CDS:1 [Paraglomus brasilianum]
MTKDEQAQERPKDKESTETLEVLDVLPPPPPETTKLEPLRMPSARNPPMGKAKETVKKITKAYQATGMAAKEAIPAKLSSDEDAFETVRGRVAVKRDIRRQRRSRSLSAPRTPPARTGTPPPSKRSHNQAITPQRPKSQKKAKVDLSYLQSGPATNKRNAWTGWQVAMALHKTSGWVETAHLNYFAIYPDVAQQWMSRLPVAIYNNCTDWLRKRRTAGKTPNAPQGEDLEKIKQETATPHPSIRISNLPPSYPLTTSPPSSSSLSSPPSDLSSVVLEKTYVNGKEMEEALLTVNSHDQNAMEIQVRYATSPSITKVSIGKLNPEIGIEEFISALGNSLKMEIKMSKEGQAIENGRPVDLSIENRDVVNLTCLSVRSTPENSPSPPPNPLGAKINIAILSNLIGGKSKLTDCYIMLKEHIGTLKERLTPQLRMEPDKYDLLHKGKILDPNMTAQEANIGTYARLTANLKQKPTYAEASSSYTALPETDMEESEDENMLDVIITVPVEYEGVIHDITTSKDKSVGTITELYIKKAQLDIHFTNFIICNEKEDIPSFYSIDYAINEGLMKYGTKLHLTQKTPPPSI